MRRFPAALVLVALALAGCAQQQDSPQPGPSASGAASTSATATGAPAAPTPSNVPSTQMPTAPGNAGEQWTTFTTADGTMAFDLPAAWSAKDPAGELAEGGGVYAEVRNQVGKVMATLRTNMAIGSSCTQKYPYDVLDTAELPALAQDGAAPQFAFETRGECRHTGTSGRAGGRVRHHLRPHAQRP